MQCICAWRHNYLRNVVVPVAWVFGTIALTIITVRCLLGAITLPVITPVAGLLLGPVALAVIAPVCGGLSAVAPAVITPVGLLVITTPVATLSHACSLLQTQRCVYLER